MEPNFIQGKENFVAVPCFYTHFPELDHLNTHRGYNYNLQAGNFQLPIVKGKHMTGKDHDMNIWMDKMMLQIAQEQM